MKLRKIFAIAGLVMGMAAMTACNSKNEVDTDYDNQEDVEDEDLNVIGEESAEQLIVEKIGEEYDIELTGTYTDEEALADAVEYESLYKYYIFSVSKEGEPLVKEIAVNMVSGELFAYDVDNKIEDYSEFPLYNEEVDKQVSWDATAIKKDTKLILSPVDNNSVEFKFLDADENVILLGVVITEGSKAEYSDGEYMVKFEISDNKISVTEVSTKTQNYDIAGEYKIENK